MTTNRDFRSVPLADLEAIHRVAVAILRSGGQGVDNAFLICPYESLKLILETVDLVQSVDLSILDGLNSALEANRGLRQAQFGAHTSRNAHHLCIQCIWPRFKSELDERGSMQRCCANSPLIQEFRR